VRVRVRVRVRVSTITLVPNPYLKPYGGDGRHEMRNHV
jgi:hypothetical protein